MNTQPARTNSDPLLKAHASGYPLQGRRRFQGLDISIENRVGSWRIDRAHNPPRWKTRMTVAYGYVKGSCGVDGDHVDCYIGPNDNASHAYIVRQVDPESGRFDEQKVMLGFDSSDAAKKAYLKHYDSPKFFGGIQGMPMEDFKKKVLATLHGPKLIKSLDQIIQEANPPSTLDGLDARRVYAVLKSITSPNTTGLPLIYATGEPLREPAEGEALSSDWLDSWDWADANFDPDAPFSLPTDRRIPLTFCSSALRGELVSAALSAGLEDSLTQKIPVGACFTAAMGSVRRRRAQAALLAHLFFAGIVSQSNIRALCAGAQASPEDFASVLLQFRPDLGTSASAATAAPSAPAASPAADPPLREAVTSLFPAPAPVGGQL